jgi:hypothetical protein
MDGRLRQGHDLATVSSSWDDPRVPNRHRIILSTNPDEATLRERAEALAREIDPEASVDFLFDRRKNLAFVTISTPTDEDVKFKDLVDSLSDIDPKNIYAIGPINIHVDEAS